LAKFFITPSGELVHPWINKADTKFASDEFDGLYHTKLALDASPETTDLINKVRGASLQALAEITADMKPGEAKKWSVYEPFADEEDEDGVATGRILFNFKQNQFIPLKDPVGHKEVHIELRDSQDQVVTVNVWGGTIARVMFSMRTIKLAKDKQAGVRLDFAKVQIIKLAESSGGGQGFGAVDGGFEGSQESQGFGQTQGDSSGGDY